MLLTFTVIVLAILIFFIVMRLQKISTRMQSYEKFIALAATVDDIEDACSRSQRSRHSELRDTNIDV